MPEIPQAILDEIKRRIDLSALISEHVTLKRSGRGFLGLCPFHDEKTPSFHVDAERGFYHCFGCNAGGNAFTFLTRLTGVTFPEAVRTLAERANVQIPEAAHARGHDRLAEANALAAELFAVVLHETRLGERARAYLADRGFADETVRRFQLGFAPASGWIEKLAGRGVSMGDLKRLGLARDGRSGLFPMFRDRLMFPIRDLGGRVIAFGGRAIGETTGPKYLNSPETPLFRKGHHLYGLELARDAIRANDQVILVEGYMDAIALSQAGLKQTVAVLGTALTADQLRLARRFAEEIVVCFDGDEAGRRAALRAFPICVDEVDLWPRAVFLPQGEDPDSLVRKGGPEAMLELVRKGQSLIDFFLDDLVGPDAGVGETARAASRMASVLAGVKDPIVRDKLVRGAAGRLGVSGEALLAAARQVAAANAAKAAPARSETRVDPRAGTRVDVRGDPRADPRGSVPSGAGGGPAGRAGRRGPRVAFSGDAEMVELVICDEEAAERMRREGASEWIEDALLRVIAERVLERRETDEYFEPMELAAGLPAAMAERVRLRLASPPTPEDNQRAADDWFARHAERLARGDRRALIARLRAAEHRGDQAEVDAALEELRRMTPEPRAGEDSELA